VFVAIGRGIVESNEELSNPVGKFGLGRQFLLLGERNDIDNVMGSLDLLISTSAWGEGFPNVVGEAMSSGVPCVVTNVGESSHLVGSSGFVVEPRDPHALGEAILCFLDLTTEEKIIRSTMAKERIANNFSMEHVGREYLHLYCLEN
jgi:glycosyltransferase involved in cell wall biosynthesis